MIKWQDIITPSTVTVFVGKKGSGKSGLGYFLLEILHDEYNLIPVVAGFPREKQYLLPSDFVIKDLDEALDTENAIIFIDEGTTLLPAGQKLDEIVKMFIALSRQRNQIVLFAFHASRDIGSKILRGVDIIVVKKPSKRQIEHGSKTAWWSIFLNEAAAEFSKIKDDKRKYAYVDCEEPEFRGMLKNPLPIFWGEELSRAYAGISLIGGESTPGPLKWVGEWTKDHDEMKNRLLVYAAEHKMIFDPKRDIEGFVGRFLIGRYCAIYRERTICPCELADTCGLFFKKVRS